MQITEQIANALGRKAMARALGVGAAAISKEVLSGDFPAGWYLVVKEMCDERGIECPHEIFNFKSPSAQLGSKALACNGHQHAPSGGKRQTSHGRKAGAA